MSPSGDEGPLEPSDWVRRFATRVPAGGEVLDLACGTGRHVRLFLSGGHRVTAVDARREGLADLAGTSSLEIIQADLEAEPWPLGERRFAGVIVTNYLWRPLLAKVVAAVATGGVLIYDTFAAGNELLGKPRNPAFLLRPGELLEAVHDHLTVLAYEHGEVDRPRPAVRQRICARR